MNKVLLVIDDANLAIEARKWGKRPNYALLRGIVVDVESGRQMVEAIVFTTLPAYSDGIRRYHYALRCDGFIVIERPLKPEGRSKGNVDVLMTIETIKWALNVKPDVVVLASGDGDFAPLAMYLRSLGIRVEVASQRESMAGDLRIAANRVIDLSDWVNKCEGINGESAELHLARTDVPAEPPREEGLSAKVLRVLQSAPQSKNQIAKGIGKKKVDSPLEGTLRDLIAQGLVEYTKPDNPNSRLQKYRLTARAQSH